MVYEMRGERNAELTASQREAFTSDAETLRKEAEKIIALLNPEASPAGYRQIDRTEILLSVERCLNSVVNLLDIENPTHREANVFRDGYTVVTGSIGISKTGGSYE